MHDAPFFDQIRDYLNNDTHAHGSIACVTGFLINIVEQTVQLIAPTHATDEFPVGYITFATARWHTPNDIAEAVADVVRRGRSMDLLAHHRCALAPYVIPEVDGSDVVFVGRLGTRIRVASLGSNHDVSNLVLLLRDGSFTRSSVEEHFADKTEWVTAAIDRLWLLGVLVEPTS